ncbi:MAG: N-acetylglucosamine kinase [Bacteroidota bacterium]
MLLVADSGSTKTDWRLITEKKNILQFSTIGFNPYFVSTGAIAGELRSSLLPHLSVHLGGHEPAIYFYGAGCGTEDKKRIVSDALSQVFPGSRVEVEHDLLGAARALCGRQEGIAAILGTGSNSCYYDGREIKENIPSLGFILGDEGSGAVIGKLFISAYLSGELPGHLAAGFYERFKIGRAEILDAVYKQPFPNRYLASFTRYIFQKLDEPYCSNLVASCFRDFFDKHICKYPKYKEVKMGCAGSVGYYFSNILRRVAEEKGVTLDKVIETPIAGLTLYHLETEN